MTLLLPLEHFANSIVTQGHPGLTWQSDVERYLRIFDAAGVLKPIHRVVLPAISLHAPTIEEDPSFHRFASMHESWRDGRPDSLTPYRIDDSGDPLAAHPLLAFPEWLGKQIQILDGRNTSPNEDTTEGAGANPSDIPYYGSWQNLDLWAAIERWTVHHLMDPMAFPEGRFLTSPREPDAIGNDLWRTTGTPRPHALLQEMHAARWLEALDLFTASRQWLAQGLEGLSDPEQKDGISAVREMLRTRVTGEPPWCAITDDETVEHLRRLAELHGYMKADISATSWTVRRYFVEGVRLHSLRSGVGEVDICTLIDAGPVRHLKCRARAILRPDLHQAYEQIDRHKGYLFRSLVRQHPEIRRAADEIGLLLKYLESRQMLSWALELGETLRLFNERGDQTTRQRFLRLRSLAMQLEAIITVLCEDIGNEQDIARAQGRDSKIRHVALLDRASDSWRGEACNDIKNFWKRATQTHQRTIEDSLAMLDAVKAEIDARQKHGSSVAYSILCQVMLRNLGGHQGDREWRALSGRHDEFLGHVLISVMVYWTAAREDGLQVGPGG